MITGDDLITVVVVIVMVMMKMTTSCIRKMETSSWWQVGTERYYPYIDSDSFRGGSELG